MDTGLEKFQSEDHRKQKGEIVMAKLNAHSDRMVLIISCKARKAKARTSSCGGLGSRSDTKATGSQCGDCDH